MSAHECWELEEPKGPKRTTLPDDYGLQGYLTHKKLPTPLGLPKGPGQSPTLGSQAAAVSYEQGDPVGGVSLA